MNKFSLRALALLASLPFAGAGAGAQGIQVSPRAFPGNTALPFAPALGSAAPVAAIALSDREGAWEIRSTDIRLDHVLQRWAQAAGWRLQWDAAKHVELAGPNVFRGSFESAVAQVLETPGIRLSEYPLEGCIYPNTPRLMRITRLGDQVHECPEEFK